jgi:anthranilate synthase/aminodeoxychorismate synthase-like glutamine amidotransferase
MVFVLDNYDSFTYNLVQYIGELGEKVVVRRNDELTPAEVVALKPSHILLSPGPCTPQEAGILIPLLQHLAQLPAAKQIPTLGVCLGHQAIGAAFGGEVIRAPQLMHGKTSSITHDGRSVFKSLPDPMTCTRYHSLIVREDSVPHSLEVSARVAGESTIMGLRHKTLPIEGVQFHPESVLTNHGKQLIANFLKQDF